MLNIPLGKKKRRKRADMNAVWDILSEMSAKQIIDECPTPQ
jgi:hypothetical protein